MKHYKPSIKKLAGEAVLLGVAVLANKFLEKTEKKINEHNRSDKALERKLAITSIIYHAIGIFYNE